MTSFLIFFKNIQFGTFVKNHVAPNATEHIDENTRVDFEDDDLDDNKTLRNVDLATLFCFVISF